MNIFTPTPRKDIIMQTTFKLFISFLLCFGLFLVSGCGRQGTSTHPPELVGKWEQETQMWGLPKNMELLKDGTVIASGGGLPGNTWKAEGGRFYFMGSRGGMALDYKISGLTLTFTHDDGGRVVYRATP